MRYFSCPFWHFPLFTFFFLRIFINHILSWKPNTSWGEVLIWTSYLKVNRGWIESWRKSKLLVAKLFTNKSFKWEAFKIAMINRWKPIGSLYRPKIWERMCLYSISRTPSIKRLSKWIALRLLIKAFYCCMSFWINGISI